MAAQRQPASLETGVNCLWGGGSYIDVAEERQGIGYREGGGGICPIHIVYMPSIPLPLHLLLSNASPRCGSTYTSGCVVDGLAWCYGGTLSVCTLRIQDGNGVRKA